MTFRVLGWPEWGKPSHHTWFGQVTCPTLLLWHWYLYQSPWRPRGPGEGFWGLAPCQCQEACLGWGPCESMSGLKCHRYFTGDSGPETHQLAL